MTEGPEKADISQIFKRLRAIPSNKVCFDCGAKNPTWASVTYGVFICIDCSAVHRSLGVHLSFVRSTQLDTNWTWLHLRGMQVGGNASATVFFQQHNCTSTDTQQKYNSRAAQLYREKLASLSATAMKLHGTKLHIDTGHNEAPHFPEVTDVDFFKEHSEAALFHPADDYDGLQNGSASFPKPIVKSGNNDIEGPNIEAALSVSPTEAQKAQQARKSTIGARRVAGTKGMGAKRVMGAQKVTADFSEIEKEAQRFDQLKAQAITQEKQVSKADEERNIASVRLAYQDLGLQQKKTEEKLRQTDPKKAAQLERLGMGFGGGRLGSSGVSHSAASDMKVIQQENPMRSGGGGSRSRDLEDDFEIIGFTSGPPKYGDSPFMSRSEDRNVDKMMKDTWDEKIDRKGSFSETILPLEREENTGRSRKGISHSASSTPGGDEAQKKFGNAKSISSEQFFGGGRDFDYERRANLAKFEGSSSISSADYFGDGSRKQKEPAFNSPNLYDIKEGVKDGVSKVAGRLSSLANGVMSSLQDRYGY